MMKLRRNITISILALVVVVGLCLSAWGDDEEPAPELLTPEDEDGGVISSGSTPTPPPSPEIDTYVYRFL